MLLEINFRYLRGENINFFYGSSSLNEVTEFGGVMLHW
jgi:hypothetical protein